MVVANEVEDGFDLDKIDAEIKIEKIRQTASKLSWDGFQQALRRNLMEKRFVFDTEGRIDLLHAISTIRRNLPGAFSLHNKITSCKIGYFGKPAAASDDAFEYVKKGDFGSLRTKIFAVIATVPSGLSAAEKSLCVAALDIFEAYLSASNDVKPSFENIGTFPLGFLFPRTALRPARIFYTVEPSYMVIKKAQLELSDFDNLDYMELSVATVDREVELPAGDVNNPWSAVLPCKASFQLRFSSPMLFSYGMWRRLERHLARPAAVKENVNLYRYMSGFKFQESELMMRTSFPEPYLQHRYIVSNSSLLEERDCVISEICIGNGSYLTEIVSIVRAQAIHNSLWESLLAMCSGKCKSEQPNLDVCIVPSPARYELSFCAANKMYLVRIELTREFEWIGTVEDANGAAVSADLNSLLTQRINRTRSIPVALVRVLKELGCETVHDRTVCEDQMSMEVDYEHGVVSRMDKVGNAWLPMFNRSRQPKKSCQPNLPEFTFEVHTVPLTTPGGLLASYKEIASERGARPLTAARAEARTHLMQSDTALAISDLEAICQLADGMDDDSKTSTPSLPARHSTSPASSRAPGCGGGSGPGSGVPQLSPLETARLKMTHSVGAAAAVGLASATPDVFEFADDRSVGSGSAYPSPSPQFTPFACSTAGSPLAGQSIRGATTKRRPRARKTANIGDRIGDFPSSIMKGPTITGVSTRKPRGKTGVRRPRGSRKAALTITHAELEMHSRVPPPLQRSYSDYEQLSNPGLVGVSTSPYVDTESDDECDPPPPPKSLGIFQSPATSHTLTVSLSANSPSHYVQSMSPLYATSGTPSVSTAHPPQSPLATASPSVSQPSTVPSPRSNQSKRPSVDAVVGRVKTTVPQQTTSATKRSVFNDLYDDGTESSPPPEERTSLASTISSTANTSVSATPLQSTTITTQA
uniref:Tetratricopeptide repeat (TPR)-like superfamily protein n=1 Tax=Angiostrongylus cantonensis TaxID=6313 RepID=A0A158PBH8_ANGCA